MFTVVRFCSRVFTVVHRCSQNFVDRVLGFGRVVCIMTEEQKIKMAEGRRARKGRVVERTHKIMVESEEGLKERARHVPESQRQLFMRVWTGKAGRAERVKAKCLDCCCYQREEVRLCMSKYCPLWSIRPFQGMECV